MEHLTLPEGTTPFITVPYYAPDNKDWYDGKGHERYPERMGWTKESLLGQVPHGKSSSPFGNDKLGQPRDDESIIRFFQSWLFFGTAIEFFKVGGGHVLNTESFIYRADHPKKSHIVQTTYLRMYLGTIWGKSTRDKEILWRESSAILSCTLVYLNHFCQEPKERHPSNRTKPVTWPVKDEISTSSRYAAHYEYIGFIGPRNGPVHTAVHFESKVSTDSLNSKVIALVFTLVEAAKHKCGRSTFPVEIIARSAMLHRRLERKWCLADATRFEDELGIDGHYYLAASPGLQEDELDNHYRCTRDRCHYDKDETTYITKHAPAPWHNSGCERATWGGQFGGELLVEKKVKAKNWLDSIVKVIDNGAIPIVLWSVSQKKYYTVEFHTKGELTPPYVAISHVWSDGKGNPTENYLPQCQIENIHDMIDKIQYEGRRPQGAGTGFWMDTLCIPVGKDYKDQKDKAIKSMKVLYARAKAVLVLDEWLRQISSTAPAPEILARTYQSNWIKRLWTHQEGFFPKELWVQFKDRAIKMESIADKAWEYEQSQIPKSIYAPWILIASGKSAQQYVFFKQAYNNIRKRPEDMWKLYEPMTDIMHLRRTSRQADETICLATILDIPLDKYIVIDDKPDDVAARDRMCVFLKDVKKFQTGLIFNRWDRLQVEGFGWAPKSLLSHRGGLGDSELGVFELQESEPAEIQYIGKAVAGLPVKYPGFASFDFSGFTRLPVNCGDRAFVIQCSKDYYVVEVSRNDVPWDRRNTYSMILSKVPQVDSKDGVAAVIGQTTGVHGGVVSFRHLCCAQVFMVRTYAQDCVDIVKVALLGAGTKWLVS